MAVSAAAAAAAAALAKGAKLVDCSHTITPKTLTFAQVRPGAGDSGSRVRTRAVLCLDVLTVVVMMMMGAVHCSFAETNGASSVQD